MSPRASDFSTVSVGTTQLVFYAGDRPVASVSASSTPESVLLRFVFHGHDVVARGDLLDSRWRSHLATDVRLCYGPRKADRTVLLRMFSEIATCWDTFTSTGSVV